MKKPEAPSLTTSPANDPSPGSPKPPQESQLQQSQPRRRLRRFWVGLVLIAIPAGAAGLWFGFPALRPVLAQAISALGPKAAAPAVAATPVRGVRVMTVSFAESTERRSYTGVVVPRWETQLGFRVGGKISARQVDVSQHVKAGDILFQLDDADYMAAMRAAEAELAALRAQARQALLEEERQRDLLAKGFATRSAFDRVTAAAVAAAEQVKAADQKLLLARNQLAYVALRAPHDGVITAIRAEAGQVVPQGQPVLFLARSDEREALVSVPEGQVQGLASWRAETAFAPSSKQRTAISLREVAAQADPASRTFAARYSLPQNGVDALPFGSTVTIDLARQSQSESSILPASAVMVQAGEASVWVIGPSGERAERRAVQIVDLGTETARVTGLHSGMRVVTLGVHRLDAGMPVRIIEEDRRLAVRP